MNLRKSEMATLGIVALSIIVGVYFYPQMPESMATHWNASGEVNGHMERLWGLFLVPVIMAGLVLLFIAIPRIDPLKANIEQFRNYYDGFIVVLSLFMLCVYFQTVLWNLGVEVSPNIVLPIGLGLLYYYMGILMEHARRNYFIGIRTPWTLSSDRVWDKTHKLGSKLFKVAGAVALVGAAFPRHAIWFILIPVVLVAAYTVVYSYVEYQKEQK
ncbi:MAG: SdpI family protein, partial [Dehalococcoidia bacterium]|nr:SdpI family protein [Dehalococcoidia bacterium]